MTLPPRRLAILGATGSIGTQAIEVVRQLRARGEPVEVVALAAGRQVAPLAAFARELGTKFVSVAGPEEEATIRSLLPPGIEVVCGPEGLERTGPGQQGVLGGGRGARPRRTAAP